MRQLPGPPAQRKSGNQNQRRTKSYQQIAGDRAAGLFGCDLGLRWNGSRRLLQLPHGARDHRAALLLALRAGGQMRLEFLALCGVHGAGDPGRSRMIFRCLTRYHRLNRMT